MKAWKEGVRTVKKWEFYIRFMAFEEHTFPRTDFYVMQMADRCTCSVLNFVAFVSITL